MNASTSAVASVVAVAYALGGCINSFDQSTPTTPDNAPTPEQRARLAGADCIVLGRMKTDSVASFGANAEAKDRSQRTRDAASRFVKSFRSAFFQYAIDPKPRWVTEGTQCDGMELRLTLTALDRSSATIEYELVDGSAVAWKDRFYAFANTSELEDPNYVLLSTRAARTMVIPLRAMVRP